MGDRIEHTVGYPCSYPTPFTMPIRPASLCISLMMVATGGLSAIASPLSQPSPTANTQTSGITRPSTPPPMPSTLPGLVSRRIQRDLAKRLNVSSQTINVGEATVQNWNNTCLNLPQVNESCQNREVQGWQVSVESEQQRWIYHSDRIGQRLRLQSADDSAINPSDFSAQLSQALLTHATEQTQQPALQILSVQTAQWRNGCLEISEPDTTCTQAEVQGYRVILSNGSRDLDSIQTGEPGPREWPKRWVYHLSADGSQIVQNTLASEAKDYTGTYFISPRRTPVVSSELPSPVVFQSFTQFDGIDILSLTADGKVYFERQNDRRPDEAIAPELIHQISSESVIAFQQLLQQQRFSDFSQVGYSNEDITTATHGGYTMRDTDSMVSIDTEPDRLPDNLHAVVDAWESIAVFFR